MCVDPILWNCVGSRSYDFSRVWWVSGWERGPPPHRPRTNIWTSHTPLASWDLGLSRDVWGVQIFVRGRRVAEEWCGPWCSDPTIYDLLTRLSFSLTRVSTLGYFDLRWRSNDVESTAGECGLIPGKILAQTRWRKQQEQRLESEEDGECRHWITRDCIFIFMWNMIMN